MSLFNGKKQLTVRLIGELTEQQFIVIALLKENRKI